MTNATVQLFLIKGDSESKQAKSLLKKTLIPFKEIDLVKSGTLAFIERNLGVKHVPFLISGQSMYEGLAQIRAFTRNG